MEFGTRSNRNRCPLPIWSWGDICLTVDAHCSYVYRLSSPVCLDVSTGLSVLSAYRFTSCRFCLQTFVILFKVWLAMD
uniref:MPK2 n=1 Tax=Arundo donax TaxID=35708 RepID=A0A0A9CM71_ARUDO